MLTQAHILSPAKKKNEKDRKFEIGDIVII